MSALKRAVRQGLERVGSELEFQRSRRLRLERMPTVCLALGPYRNLTTLTAGLLSLHPECQVLNHGAARVFPIRQVDFLRRYSDKRFLNFTRYAIYLSQGGRRGNFGGSITLAHAFDHGAMRDAYRARYGESLVKPEVGAVFWKESMRVSNRIRERGVDLGELFAANDRVRFLMPIRNPLDCALSNQKTGHARHFHGLGDGGIEEILDRVLDEIAAEAMNGLSDFLEVSRDERWVRDSLACYDLKPPYAHDPALVDHYRKSLQQRFSEHAQAGAHLERFAR
jgi:hypothetical protein